MEINKVYNEDCRETMFRMPESFVDLVVTSPPYDNLRSYNGVIGSWCEQVWREVIKELFRVTKQGGVVVWVVGDATIKGSETGTSFKQALWAKECGFNLHDTMIYQKKGFSFPDSTRYHQVWEYMFVFSKGKPKTFNPICDRKNETAGARLGGDYKRAKDGTSVVRPGSKNRGIRREFGQRFNVWLIGAGCGQSSSDLSSFKHPAIFPEKLAHDHIISWSNPGDLVYDPFMGSGTVAKVAGTLKRNWIGSEISPEYCEIIRERLDTP